MNYFAYNFIKIHHSFIHRSLAGVTESLWSVEDLVDLWEAYETQKVA